MASRKIALVTGGNNGIGYETVKALLESTKPYHVLLGSRSLEKGKLAIENLHKECPDLTNTVEIVQVDITSDESIEKAYKQVETSHGHIDALINNAGSYISHIQGHRRRLTRPSDRHPSHSRQSLAPRVLHERLRHELIRDTCADLHTHAPPPQVRRPAAGIRLRPLQHHHRGRGLLPHPAAARGVAEDGRLRDDSVPLYEGRAEHADA